MSDFEGCQVNTGVPDSEGVWFSHMCLVLRGVQFTGYLCIWDVLFTGVFGLQEYTLYLHIACIVSYK